VTSNIAIGEKVGNTAMDTPWCENATRGSQEVSVVRSQIVIGEVKRACHATAASCRETWAPDYL
jgi:hypothetical protein